MWKSDWRAYIAVLTIFFSLMPLEISRALASENALWEDELDEEYLNVVYPPYVCLGVGLVLSICLMGYFYIRRQRNVQHTHVRRVGLLYAQYFGVNGSHFTWKVAAFQWCTVAMQGYSKLIILGEQVNGSTSKAVYWVYLGMLCLNATLPAVLLRSKDPFYQRVVVCFMDIFFDLWYSLGFAFFLFLHVESPQLVFPVDVVSWSSNFLPIIHFLSVARAIENHKSSSLELETETKPLPGKASIMFVLATVVSLSAILAVNPDVYPLGENACAPCRCSSDNILIACDNPIVVAAPRLDLSGRGIEEISIGALSLLVKTKEIDLSNNKLQRIKSGTFDDLSELKRLILQDNKITTLEEASFGNLPQLGILELHGNDPLPELQQQSFSNLPHLEHILLPNNDAFPSNPCGPSCFCLADGALICCKHGQSEQNVNLWGRGITRIAEGAFPATETNPNRIEKLHLGSNKISTISQEVLGKLSSLREIDLSSNPIAKGTVEAIVSNTNLTTISIFNTTVTCEDVPSKPENCHDGRLNDPCFPTCLCNEGELLRCKDVEEIDLYAKGIRAIDEGAFSNLGSVERLFLSRNVFTDFVLDVGIFSDMVSLQTLYLDSCQLGVVQGNFSERLVNLHEVDIFENKLTDASLSSTVFRPLPSIEAVFMYNNEVVCADMVFGDYTSCDIYKGEN